LITASSCSTNSPACIGGYLLASGDSAKWPKGFNTASDAMWANNYIRRREKEKVRFIQSQNKSLKRSEISIIFKTHSH
jgi:hypothetical protein